MAAAGVSDMQPARWAAVFTVRAGTRMVSNPTATFSGGASADSTHSCSGARAARTASSPVTYMALRVMSTW